MLPSTTKPATFTLKCQGNWLPCISRTRAPIAPLVTEGTSQEAWFPVPAAAAVLYSWKPAPASRPQGSHCPQALFCDCSSSCGFWTLAPSKQAPEFPLPAGLGPPFLQQLLWLLVTCTSKQVPAFPLPKGLVHAFMQCYCTALLESTPSKQAPEVLGSPLPAAAAVAPGSLCLQAGPSAPAAHRLGSPMPAATALAPGTLP
jgi:hypothetical protein